MKILILILLHSCLLTAQNIWELIPDSERSYGWIEIIESIDSNNCFLLSSRNDESIILKSANQGRTWDSISSFIFKESRWAEYGCFLSENEFYVFADRKYIFNTKDGGKSYDTLVLDDKVFFGMIMFNSKKGIVGSYPSVLTYDNWKTYEEINEFKHIVRIAKIDSSDCMMIVNTLPDAVNHIYLEAWIYDIDKRQGTKLSNIGEYLWPLKCEVIGSNIFLIGIEMNNYGGATNNIIYKSSDLGKHWRKVHDVYYHSYIIPYIENDDLYASKNSGFCDISFKNDSVGVVVGAYGAILYTYDAGETWYYEKDYPRELDVETRMRVEFCGDTPVISGSDKYLYRLKEDNLAPRPEDTITIDGYILEKGEPREGIAICLENRFAMTDSNGYFKFIRVREGNYNLVPINNKLPDYVPFDFNPKSISKKFTADTTIHIELIDKRQYFDLSGKVLKGDVGLEGILVEAQLYDKRVVPTLDTAYTDKDGIYTFYGLENRRFNLKPISSEYTFYPLELLVKVDTTETLWTPFRASPTTSVSDTPNFEIKSNVLYSKDIAGMNYKIISITGVIIAEGNLEKELDLNTYPTGTYILNIIKGEEIIFTHKFQVVK